MKVLPLFLTVLLFASPAYSQNNRLFDRWGLDVGYVNSDVVTKAAKASITRSMDDLEKLSTDENGYRMGVKFEKDIGKMLEERGKKGIVPFIQVHADLTSGLGAKETFKTNDGGTSTFDRDYLRVSLGASFGLKTPITSDKRWWVVGSVGAELVNADLDLKARLVDLNGNPIDSLDEGDNHTYLAPVLFAGLIFDSPGEGQGGWSGEIGIRWTEYEFQDRLLGETISDFSKSINLSIKREIGGIRGP